MCRIFTRKISGLKIHGKFVGAGIANRPVFRTTAYGIRTKFTLNFACRAFYTGLKQQIIYDDHTYIKVKTPPFNESIGQKVTKIVYICITMKSSKYLIIGGIALAVAGVTGITVYLIRRKYGKPPRNKTPKSILFVGDSQVAVRDANGNRISFTYPNLVASELSKRGISVDVEALPGKTSSWMKERLASKLASRKYDRVYLHGGGNDAVNTAINLNDTVANFQQMVDMAAAAGADPYVVLGYRIDNFADYRKMPLTQYVTTPEQWIPLIERRRILQKNLGKLIKGASLVPVYDIGGMTGDGIHPNAQGHKVIASKILNTV